MTHAIDAHGNVVAPQSNLHSEGDRIEGIDRQAEKEAKGYFQSVSSYIPDEEANNNIDVVKRDGSRVHAGGDHQPNDILLIDGMEVTYSMAQQLGLIEGGNFTSAQEEFYSDAENCQQEPEPQDTRPERARLLEMQLDMASQGRSQQVMDTVQNDIVHLGDFSEQTLDFAQRELSMSEESVRTMYKEMQSAGSNAMADFLEVGDGRGRDRIEFLVDLANNGTRDQRATVRNLWFLAATGRLTQAQADDAFDTLYQPYQ